jgi:hypothetical protein
MDDETRQFPKQDERDYYKLYRERITVEDQLVFYRVSWLLVSQSIMFSLWASAFFREKEPAVTPVGTLAFAVLGVLICGVIYVGILAALAAIDRLEKEYDQNQPKDGRRRPLPGLVSKGWVNWCGRLGPRLLPVLFVAAWVAVAVVAFRYPDGLSGLGRRESDRAFPDHIGRTARLSRERLRVRPLRPARASPDRGTGRTHAGGASFP